MEFTNFDKFQIETGLIDDDEKLQAIGATAFVGESCDGKFETECLAKLREFCRLNPQFHIATYTSDSDEVESFETERRAREQNLDWEAMTDDEREAFRQREEIYPITISNCERWVNRLCFYLADGNADTNIFLVEIVP